MSKVQLIVPLTALFVGQTILQPYTGSEERPLNGNHSLLIVLLKFSHCWIPVFGGIVQDHRIQLICLLEVYLQVSSFVVERTHLVARVRRRLAGDLRSKPSSEIVDPERKSKASVSCVVQPKEPFVDFTRFSKYRRLLRTVAWIRRFVSNLKVKEEERIDSPLTSLEIQNAEEWLISHVQEASFPEEITSSKQHGPVKDSYLANLNPFMCPTCHCLRVGGRIHKSLLPEEEKHPIILPSNHPVVKLLIEDVHRRELHAGVEHTLSVLRQKFWLIKGRSTVRQTLRNCLICRHYQTKPFGQQMAPLPEDRIEPAPPFANVGLDFAGPL